VCTNASPAASHDPIRATRTDRSGLPGTIGLAPGPGQPSGASRSNRQVDVPLPDFASVPPARSALMPAFEARRESAEPPDLLHGEPRLTRDVDIALGAGLERIGDVVALLGVAGLRALVDPGCLHSKRGRTPRAL
jgi:hypothetical protein